MLSTCQVSCLSCSLSRALGHHRFLYDDLTNGRILLKEDLKLLADYIVNRTSCLAVTKFLLGLAFKLWILDLDADDRGQALTDIFTA